LEQVLRQGYRAGEVRVIRRMQALLEVGAGRPAALVAKRLGLDATTVYGWLHAFMVDGLATLRSGRAPGRPSKLTPSQKLRLSEVIEAGPLAAGYPSGCGSTLFLQDLIQREFGQCYNHHYLATLLGNLGFSYQKARFVSDHLDPERRRGWREETWPAILAEATRRGALLLFGDEAGFAPWGSPAYTWARRGEQPTVLTCGKRKALKVFGLIDYFSGRCFRQHQTARFTADTYQAFLQGCSPKPIGRSFCCRTAPSDIDLQRIPGRGVQPIQAQFRFMHLPSSRMRSGTRRRTMLAQQQGSSAMESPRFVTPESTGVLPDSLPSWYAGTSFQWHAPSGWLAHPRPSWFYLSRWCTVDRHAISPWAEFSILVPSCSGPSGVCDNRRGTSALRRISGFP
jgi:transposase